MLRIIRVSFCLSLLFCLVACGNKGELIKPSVPAASASASAIEG